MGIADESAFEAGVQYELKPTRTTASFLYENLKRYAPAAAAFNERTRPLGTWLAVVQKITPADDLDLDRHRRRLGVGVKAGDSDPFYARTANNEPCAAARIAGMKQLACGVAIRELE